MDEIVHLPVRASIHKFWPILLMALRLDIVFIVEDAESFSSNDLSDFVNLCWYAKFFLTLIGADVQYFVSEYRASLAISLILCISTNFVSVNSLLSRAIRERIDLHYVETRKSIRIFDEI